MLTNLFSVQETPALIISRLLRFLGAKVTDTAIRETLLNHPNYPSLLSLSDALNKWKINNIAARIQKENLVESPLLFIAHTYIDSGDERFVLVTEVTEIAVKYIKYNGKETTIAQEQFIKDLSSVALLAEKEDASGEKYYEANRHKEKRAALKLPAILFFVLLIVMSAVFSLRFCLREQQVYKACTWL